MHRTPRVVSALCSALAVGAGVVLVTPGVAQAAVPDAPTSVTATAAIDAATVSWVAGADGGSPITGWTVTASPGGAGATAVAGAHSAVVMGLLAGTSYSFTVRATNGDGDGPVSAPSTAVAVKGPAGGLTHLLRSGRLVDTRNGTGLPKRRLGARTTSTFGALGKRGLPSSGVAAVLLDVTAVHPANAVKLTVFPAGTTRPSRPNVLAPRGQSVTTLVTVAPGHRGRVSVYAAGGPADVTVDAVGWVATAAASPTGGLQLHMLPYETRIANTAKSVGTTTIPAHGSRNLTVVGRGGVPGSGVRGVDLAITAKAPAGSGQLVAYPAGGTRPTRSDVSFSAGADATGRIVVGLNSTGTVRLANTSGKPLNVLVDAAGWLAEPSTDAPGARVSALAPKRILDTATGLGAPKGAVGSGSVRTVTVAGHGGVPKSTGQAPPTSAVLAVTVSAPTKSGTLVAFPAQRTTPVATDLSYTARHAASALVTVPLGAGGAISLRHVGGAVQLAVDVVGYLSGDAVIAPNVHLVTPATAGAITGVGPGSLTVTSSSPLAQSQVGDPITAGATSTTPHGLLVRVISVQDNGDGTTTLGTEPGSLGDVIAFGSASVTEAISPATAAAAPVAKSTTTRLTVQPAVTIGKTFHFPLDYELASGVNLSGGLDVGGSLSLDVDVHPHFDVPSTWVTVNATAAFDETLDEALDAVYEGSISKDVELAQFDLQPIPLVIGGIPVEVIPHVSATLHATGNATVSAHASISQGVHASATVTYDNGDVTPTHSFSSVGPTFSGPTVQTAMDAKVGIDFQLALLVDDIGGPQMTVTPYLRLRKTGCAAALLWGIDLSGGFDLHLVGKDYSWGATILSTGDQELGRVFDGCWAGTITQVNTYQHAFPNPTGQATVVVTLTKQSLDDPNAYDIHAQVDWDESFDQPSTDQNGQPCTLTTTYHSHVGVDSGGPNPLAAPYADGATVIFGEDGQGGHIYTVTLGGIYVPVHIDYTGCGDPSSFDGAQYFGLAHLEIPTDFTYDGAQTLTGSGATAQDETMDVNLYRASGTT